MAEDGLAYVAEGGVMLPGQGPSTLAQVPDDQAEAVIESAEDCPGECIFIEL
jgi:ferredoxin